MKRILWMLIAILICFSSLSGCAVAKYYEGPLFSASHIGMDRVTTAIELTEDTQRAILSALNRGRWMDGVINCGHDYEFFTATETVHYHSECGSFIDVTNCRAMTLDPKDKESLNKVLGVKNDNGDYWKSTLQTTVRLTQFHGYEDGKSTKTIAPGALSDAIVSAIRNMTETGKVITKIADDFLNKEPTASRDFVGAVWIEFDETTYRLDPDFKELCRVDMFNRKGYVLNMSEQVGKMIREALDYHPCDTYLGSYDNKKNEISISHVYDAPTTVHIHVKKLEVENQFRSQNRIVLELLSTTDQTVSLKLHSFQSSDNWGTLESKEVTLKAGEAQTVELEFFGWKDFHYRVNISVENTRLRLTIKP